MADEIDEKPFGTGICGDQFEGGEEGGGVMTIEFAGLID